MAALARVICDSPVSFRSVQGESTAAAAGIAWINSIGNLGGYIGPTIFGTLKDRMGNDIYAVIFLALLAAVAFVLVLIIGHDARTEQAAAPGRA